MKPQCINCQFLSKYLPDGDEQITLHWSDKDKSEGRVHSDWGAECAEGIWSNGVDPHIDLKKELYKDRTKDCYAFMKLHRGMTMEAARKKRVRIQNAARTKRERTTLAIAMIGLAVSVAAIAITAA